MILDIVMARCRWFEEDAAKVSGFHSCFYVKVTSDFEVDSCSRVRTKRFRRAEVLLQPGFIGTGVSVFHDTSRRSNMKCDVHICKELDTISCCQAA